MARSANKRSKAAAKREARVAAARRNKHIRWMKWGGIAVGSAAIIVGLISLIPDPADSPDAATAVGTATVGAPAPEVAMTAFDGERVSLSQFSGTPVGVNFWATGCPFCVAEMPDFEEVKQATEGAVQFIGANLRDDAGAAEDLVGDTGVSYLLTRDPQGVVYSAFGGVAMPTTVFIDADGIVQEVATGRLSKAQLESKIAQHFRVGG